MSDINPLTWAIYLLLLVVYVIKKLESGARFRKTKCRHFDRGHTSFNHQAKSLPLQLAGFMHVTPQEKNPGILGEMANHGSRLEKNQMSLEHLSPETKAGL